MDEDERNSAAKARNADIGTLNEVKQILERLNKGVDLVDDGAKLKETQVNRRKDKATIEKNPIVIPLNKSKNEEEKDLYYLTNEPQSDQGLMNTVKRSPLLNSHRRRAGDTGHQDITRLGGRRHRERERCQPRRALLPRESEVLRARVWLPTA